MNGLTLKDVVGDPFVQAGVLAVIGCAISYGFCSEPPQ